MKRISALLAVILLSTAFAQASLSRTKALGPVSKFLLDDADLWPWPQLAWFYTRGVFIELGDEPQEVARRSSVLGTYSSAEKTLGVFGVSVNRVSPALYDFSGYINPGAAAGDTIPAANIVELLQDRGLGADLAPIPEPQAEFDLFFARNIGGANAGLRLEYASALSADEYTGSSNKARSSSFGVAVGFGYELSQRLRIDGGIGLAALSFKSEHKIDLGGYSESLESDGGSRISLDGRLFYSLNDELSLVPVVSVSHASLGYRFSQGTQDAAAEPATGRTTTTVFGLGAGLQFRPSQRLLLVAGFEVDRRSDDVNDSLIAGSPGETAKTASATALPRLSLGMEAQLNKWLLVRCGASKERRIVAVTRDFTDGTAQKLEDQEQPYEFDAGFGIKAGGLGLDLTFNPELIYTGGKVISGSSTQPVGKASVSYRF